MGAYSRILLPWDSQPQEVVAVDWQKPISQGLVGLFPLSPASGFRDLVSGQGPTITGTVDLAANANGLFRNFGSSKYIDYASPPRGLTPTTPVTVAWTQEARSTTAQSTVLNLNVGTAGVDSSFVIYQSASTSAYYFTAGPRRTSGAQSWSAAVGALTNNVRDVFVLTSSGGLGSLVDADWELYKNGALVAHGTTTTYGTNTTAGFRVGTLVESTGDPFEGIIGDLHFWSRVLSVQERIEWSRNVNMAYVDRSIWVPVSAGGAPPATAYPWHYYAQMRQMGA